MAIVPGIGIGETRAAEPRFPAPPGYVLPWAGGEIHAITQGEETSFTHNGGAAYSYDIDLSYQTVVAARAGKVVLVRQDSNAGGCSAAFSSSANYVVVDHGDGTSGLYLHLAQDSAMVKPGDVVAQGQPLATSGETGLTCADIGNGPGPHLHFQVETTDNSRYFTQSLPIAFDDIQTNEGVPQEGSSYVSGNYGPGKPKKIRLTPHHAPREFNPVAQPAHPDLKEAPQVIEPVPTVGAQEAAPSDTPAAPTETETPAVSFGIALPATPGPTHTPSPTPSPSNTATPPPTDTPVPVATSTPVPAAATHTPAPATPTAPPAAASATPAPFATATP